MRFGGVGLGGIMVVVVVVRFEDRDFAFCGRRFGWVLVI